MTHGLPKTVGLFGLGLIGQALSTRLLAAGVAVHGYDPNPAGGEKLAKLGGTPMPAEKIWEADLVISAVFDTGQLADLIDSAPKGRGLRLMSVSTCDPALMGGIATKAEQSGIDLIEAPISGTSADLAEGEAIMMVAGNPSSIEALAPVFDVLVRAHHNVGDIGNGNNAKLAINLILGLCRVAVAEGLVFAEAIGIDPAEFLILAQDSAASSKVMFSKGPKMVARDFSPLGRVTQCAKDLRLIQETATKAGQGLPMADRYMEILERSLAAGEGDLDNSGAMLEIERTPVSTR